MNAEKQSHINPICTKDLKLILEERKLLRERTGNVQFNTNDKIKKKKQVKRLSVLPLDQGIVNSWVFRTIPVFPLYPLLILNFVSSPRGQGQ